eukprot:610330-Prorocentrum_minimum.AAC.1
MMGVNAELAPLPVVPPLGAAGHTRGPPPGNPAGIPVPGFPTPPPPPGQGAWVPWATPRFS